MGKVYLIDVTNRDCVQSSQCILSKLQKTILNIYLDEMGINGSEIGFPALEHESNYINANIQLAEKKAIKSLILSGWCRAKKEDVEKALELTNLKHLNLSMPTSDVMISGKFGGRLGKKDIIEMMCEAVAIVKDAGVETIGVNAEDASRTQHFNDQSYLIEFACAAKEVGATRIRYCDTLGFDNTFSIHDRVKRLAKAVKLPIELHCHNDLGHAVANSVEGAIGAIEAGVDAYINTTVNGMGERAGNADLVSVILALKKSSGLIRKNLLDKRVDLTKAWKICNYVANAFRLPIPINQVGVGQNAFAHESGIHADGVLKNRETYELFSPKELGREGTEIKKIGSVITVGEFSGSTGCKHVCEEFGMKLNSKEERDILLLIQKATVHNHMNLTADELKFIVDNPKEAKTILASCFGDLSV